MALADILLGDGEATAAMDKVDTTFQEELDSYAIDVAG